nr:hypothetical protein [uncultured Desulfobacter sp.]
MFTDAKTALEAGVISIEHGNLMTDEIFRMIADKGGWFNITS